MHLLTVTYVSIYFSILMHGVHSAAAPQPTSSPSALLARAQCAEDNCLRALRNHITSASSFCNTYATAVQTATDGFPTFVPTTCGPTRVSSACSCAVTKGPCATNAPAQVVQLPDFEMDTTSTSYDGPWNATDTAGHIFFIEGAAYEGTHVLQVERQPTLVSYPIKIIRRAWPSSLVPASMQIVDYLCSPFLLYSYMGLRCRSHGSV